MSDSQQVKLNGCLDNQNISTHKMSAGYQAIKAWYCLWFYYKRHDDWKLVHSLTGKIEEPKSRWEV